MQCVYVRACRIVCAHTMSVNDSFAMYVVSVHVIHVYVCDFQETQNSLTYW